VWVQVRVAITGAEGVVGRVLCSRLGARFDVLGLTFRPTEAIVGASQQRALDLRSSRDVAGAFKGCDAVIHLAALPKPWEPWSAIYENNIPIDANVFEECAKSRVPR
jgi:nucleoside-diphosphate-sugar epimerase